MYRSTTLPRVLTGVLIAVALVATTAQARPADDMQAWVAQAAAQSQKAQDLRSPDARDVARPRHEVATTQMRPVAKASTWPAHPQAIAVKPVATDSGSGGVDWASIGIGVATTLLAIGGIAALCTRRTRRLTRVHAGL